MAVGRTASGEVVFVDGAVPGDVVDVLVLRKKKSVAHGVVKQFNKYSDARIEPKCAHFWDCGGCKWQHLDYQAQAKYKYQTVVDAMTRIGKIQTEVRPLLQADPIYGYRNKLEYSFSDKRWITLAEAESGAEIVSSPGLGFHRPGSFDKIVDVRQCFLQEDLSNEIRNFVRDFTLEHGYTYYNVKTHEGLMRNMVVRNTTLGEWMLIVVFAKNDQSRIKSLMDALAERFPQITSLQYVVNKKLNDTILDQDILLYKGMPYIQEQLGRVTYKIGPKSFFQTNTKQAVTLFDVVMDFAEFQGHENVYDLYTGLGSIALYMSHRVNRVVGIEEVEPAIIDAEENARHNGIQNARFYAGDVKDILSKEFIEKHGAPDVVVTDPPRAGMHEQVIQTLLSLRAPKIVYVSCNPATQARDLALLSELYVVTKLQPVDMFPHTHHIENVALLVLKN